MDRSFKAGLRRYSQSNTRRKKKQLEPRTPPLHSGSRVKKDKTENSRSQEGRDLPTKRVKVGDKLPMIVQRTNNVAKLIQPSTEIKGQRMRFINEQERSELYQSLFWKINQQPEDNIIVKNRAYLRVRAIYEEEFEAAHAQLKKQLLYRINRRQAVLNKIEHEKQKLLEELIEYQQRQRPRRASPNNASPPA